MKVNVNLAQSKIIINLETDDEKEAIEEYVGKRGEKAIEEMFNVWLNSRIATHEDETRSDIWKKLTREERRELRQKVKDRK